MNRRDGKYYCSTYPRKYGIESVDRKHQPYFLKTEYILRILNAILGTLVIVARQLLRTFLLSLAHENGKLLWRQKLISGCNGNTRRRRDRKTPPEASAHIAASTPEGERGVCCTRQGGGIGVVREARHCMFTGERIISL